MNTELIGGGILALALIIASAQTAFALGQTNGEKSERARADRRIRGVLAADNKRKPKSPRAKQKQSRAARRTSVGTISLPTLRARS